MSEGNTPETPITPITPGMDDVPRQTVWQYDDEAMRQLGDHPPESHWSQQITQPLPRRLIGQRARMIPGWQPHIPRGSMGYGAYGVLLALAALALIVTLALVNGWPPGSSSAGSDSSQWPIPAQPASHTPSPALTTPAATSIPTSTALPTSTAQPTTTPEPTATLAPTATSTPTLEPTATPSP